MGTETITTSKPFTFAHNISAPNGRSTYSSSFNPFRSQQAGPSHSDGTVYNYDMHTNYFFQDGVKMCNHVKSLKSPDMQV